MGTDSGRRPPRIHEKALLARRKLARKGRGAWRSKARATAEIKAQSKIVQSHAGVENSAG